MNGYAVIAQGYRRILEKQQLTPQEKKETESMVKIYDFLSTLTQEELYMLVDSGVFNGIIKAYCKAALEEAGAWESTRHKTLQGLSELFNEVGAEGVYKNFGA